MEGMAGVGIVRVRSRFSVADTVERLCGVLEAKGITIFAVVDHSGEAAKVGLRMPETKLLVFGNPRAGTPVMLAAPISALDLPLKVLVRAEAGGSGEEEGGMVVKYNDPRWLAARHGVPGSLWGCWRGWRVGGWGGIRIGAVAQTHPYATISPVHGEHIL